MTAGTHPEFEVAPQLLGELPVPHWLSKRVMEIEYDLLAKHVIAGESELMSDRLHDHHGMNPYLLAPIEMQNQDLITSRKVGRIDERTAQMTIPIL